MEKRNLVITVIVTALLAAALSSGVTYLLFSSQLAKQTPYTPPVTGQTQQTQPTSVQDASREPTGSAETANWKTYTNAKYGYAVKYPDNWHVKECSDDPAFSYTTSNLPVCGIGGIPSFPVWIRVGSAFGTPFDLDEYIRGATTSLIGASRTAIEVDGHPAVKLVGTTKEKAEGPGLPEGIQVVEIIFVRNNIPYGIYYYGYPGKNYPGIFNQILSTFQFIN